MDTPEREDLEQQNLPQSPEQPALPDEGSSPIPPNDHLPPEAESSGGFGKGWITGFFLLFLAFLLFRINMTCF